MATRIGQVLQSDKIGSLTESGGTITLGPSRITIGGVQVETDSSLQVTPSGLTANTRYQIFAVLSSGSPILVTSTNENSVGPAGHNAWKLVGSFYTDGSGNFSVFLDIDKSASETAGFTAVKSLDQTISTTNQTRITWDVDRDTVGAWDSGNNEYVIPSDGFYLVTGYATLTGVTVDELIEIFITLNGNNTRRFDYRPNTTFTETKPFAYFDYFNKDDKIAIEVSSNADTNYDFVGGNLSYFSITSFPDSSGQNKIKDL